MKIHTLRLSVFEQNINDLIRKYAPDDQPIENLAASVSARGVTVTGVYPLFINVHFETLWELGIEQGMISARLSHLKAMGVPGNIFKSAIMKMIEDLARTEAWIRIKGDTILMDIEAVIARHAFPVQLNFARLECRAGEMVLESWAPQAPE